MKKILTIIMALALVAAVAVGLVACGNSDIKDATEVELPALTLTPDMDYSSLPDLSNFKIGMICLHGTESTYDLNFINAAKAAVKALGMSESQLIIKTGIAEGEACYTTAIDLVKNRKCNVIFADSFGHEEYMIRAARECAAEEEYSGVQFCHATGYMAALDENADLSNFHNAFASIYEGRFLAGIAAGMKLYEMNKGKAADQQNYKMGYVGAWTYAEVISGYTSFFLGAKYALNQKEAGLGDKLTMDVKFTGSWFDITAEKNAANALINRGCALISQHADSMGAPSACEAAGVPNVSYNGSTIASCPNTFLVSSRIDWTPYVKYIIAKTAKGEAFGTNYTGTLKNGSVALTALNGDAIAEGTVDAIVAARAKLIDGTLKVFDTSTFTVGGSALTTADDALVHDGAYNESSVVSAPSFDKEIDGIKLLNRFYSAEQGEIVVEE